MIRYYLYFPNLFSITALVLVLLVINKIFISPTYEDDSIYNLKKSTTVFLSPKTIGIISNKQSDISIINASRTLNKLKAPILYYGENVHLLSYLYPEKIHCIEDFWQNKISKKQLSEIQAEMKSCSYLVISNKTDNYKQNDSLLKITFSAIAITKYQTTYTKNPNKLNN
jgi:hypothetical protein